MKNEILVIRKIEKIESWQDINDYFEFNGSIFTKKSRHAGCCISLRFQEKEEFLLTQIKKFLGYGTVVARKECKGSYVYSTNSRADILDFVLNVRAHSNLRRPVIDFLLKNYQWQTSSLNTGFNNVELERLNEKWRLLVRQNELLILKANHEKELEGGAK